MCGIGGTRYESGAANPTNACESCRPAVGASVWSDVTDGTLCGGGGICHLGACVSGCEIADVYYMTDATDPNNVCASCQPGTATAAWSPIEDGTDCGNGQICGSGKCGTNCDIAGKVYASGATANDGCESCQPATSTTEWTHAGAVSCNGSGTCASGSCVMPPSCVPAGTGTSECGSANESCCTSPEVTGGTYYRTYTYGDTSSYADPATVSGFRLDKYLVTVGRFRQFVAAWNNGAGYLPSQGSGKHAHLDGGQGLANSGAPGTYETGWDATDWSSITYVDPTDANLSCDSPSPWTNTPGGLENLPIECVNWWEAYAFCIWDGGFLPSEAEWEYAASGGGGANGQREYPWGTKSAATYQYAIYNFNYPASTANETYIAPVGTALLGAGYWGQVDMAGEVDEWNIDWSAPYVDPCTDCADVTPASSRVISGSNAYYPVTSPSYRGDFAPTDRDDGTGFRCARTP